MTIPSSPDLCATADLAADRSDATPSGAAEKTEYTAAERRQRIFAIVGASSGNLVEWFDFYVYAFCAIYFAPAFFPTADPTVQLLNTAGVFAAGFLMRPIGGWLFGRIADKHGRKTSMLISVLMMCAGSLVIAFLPTYESIGVAAPALLLFCRLFQGLSVGGEYGTTATYMSEVALKGKRGFYSSFQYVTLIGGQLLAVLVVVILQQLLSTDELKAWGWRIPFVIGAIAAVIALLLRRSLEETTTAESRASKEAGSMAGLFKHHKAAFITVLGYTAGGSLMFYTFTTYMQKYLVNTAGMDAKTASGIMTFALFCYMLMQPLFGALSDRIGRRTSMLCFAALGALCTLPILATLKGIGSPALAGALIILGMAIVSFYTSIGGIVKAEMFPPEVRALGVGLSYAIANALFGGTAEYVALGLKSIGHEEVFYWYVTGMLVIAFLFSLRLPKQAAYLHHDR
ncbi:dicarboxylate or citrate transporter (MFS superfamily) [Azotobacter vinelandii CA]|uniref:Alpha-ketoglutarate permease n=2 Tax=Azotobacter vinelandii TaxID=354 RepID=C1DDP6_AZOVD|nr:MFS family transporter [Azotobacter vinelandii]ACO78017.1 dicarboxylate or citrate transporter (MFS superfamily) [Azotobacter vinelandii DJ]AGK15171.1 dicarboxylate or citrate transporter (MFS superfamily) [Azotobacter vinelandii CA]AGK20173.1 dicarboxylate or citrate transporter (MFS superfamily) [Azotobacter vinelandii CA6]WKN23740.1 metabolite/H+ symporter [Azotobacter vinelandii]SFX91468.1 MFS transporter, MHS family, alpha-ketoglutarate permease [Azotobacter vinelandii]